MNTKLNETKCWFCEGIIDRLSSKKRNFCCDKHRLQYYKGIRKGLWKYGDLYVMPSEKKVKR